MLPAMTQAGLRKTTGYHLFGNCHRGPQDFPKHLTLLGSQKQTKEKARLAAGLGMLDGLGASGLRDNQLRQNFRHSGKSE